MHSEYAVRLSLDEELDLPLGVEVRLSAGVGQERERALLVLYALFLQVLFRLADPRNFGVCIYDARDCVIADMTMPAVNIFYRGDALFLGFVRKHRSEGHVANTFDVRHARVKLVIDHDAPARVDFDADLFEVEALDVWPASDGDENNVRLELHHTVWIISPRKKNIVTHRILFAVLSGLRRDEHLPILLFR